MHTIQGQPNLSPAPCGRGRGGGVSRRQAREVPAARPAGRFSRALPRANPAPERPGTWVTLLSGHMGNTFSPRRLEWRFAAGTRPRRNACEVAPLIQVPEHDRAIVDAPLSVIARLEPDRFVDQRLADEHTLAAPLDLAPQVHATHGVAAWVFGLAQAAAVAPRRRGVVRRRRRLAERLVRPLLVEDAAERVETPLLLAHAGGRRRGGVFLPGAMQTLVPPVLLRAPPGDPLGHDPRLDQPYRQCRQTARRRAGKGRPVVAA